MQHTSRINNASLHAYRYIHVIMFIYDVVRQQVQFPNFHQPMAFSTEFAAHNSWFSILWATWQKVENKDLDSAKLQSQVVTLKLHKHQHLSKDASTFKIKDFSSKISEMNQITWTNIYTIHLCKYGQTPSIPPGGAVWISRAAALAATRRRFRTMGLAPLTRRAGPAVDRSVVSSENQLYSLTNQHVGTREVWRYMFYTWQWKKKILVACFISFFYIMYCIDVLSPFLSMSVSVAGTVYAISWNILLGDVVPCCLQTYRNWSCLIPIWGWYFIIASRLKVGDSW